MLVVMMLPFVAACSNSADRERYREHVDVSPAVGTWRCVESTDISGGQTLEGLFVDQSVSIYSNNLFTSTSSSFGTLGSYEFNGQKIVVNTNNGRTFVISAVSFSGNRMTITGSGDGVTFTYVFEKVENVDTP